MSCTGHQCYIATQEARNPILREFNLPECPTEQISKLEEQAKNRILNAAKETIDSCPEGCKCVLKEGAKPDTTNWEEVLVEPFEVIDGNCTLKVEKATVETRVLTQRGGTCKKTRIKVPSIFFIEEGVKVTVEDLNLLSTSKIQALKEVFANC